MTEMWYTTDSSLFNKYYRLYLSQYGSSGVKCSICPPHGCENHNSNGRIHNWKRFRRFQQRWMNSRLSIRYFNDYPEEDDYAEEC